VSRPTTEAAERFAAEILPGFCASRMEGVEPAVLGLLEAAFHLYQRHRGCQGPDAREWAWPYLQLNQAQPFTQDLCPWTVLLREAYSLAADCPYTIPPTTKED
jgi:hypothetical protein